MHASGDFSLYYDIELFEDIGLTGGKVLPTTTIITKNRIFIPVPNNLKKFFELTGDKKSKTQRQKPLFTPHPTANAFPTNTNKQSTKHQYTRAQVNAPNRKQRNKGKSTT